MPFEVRYSPGFQRARRRRVIVLGCFGMLLALVSLADAIYALRHHTQVTMGPAGHILLPPSLVIAMAVLLFVGSAWALARSRRP